MYIAEKTVKRDGTGDCFKPFQAYALFGHF